VNKLSALETKVQWNGDSALTLFFEAEAGEDLTRHILALVDVFKSTFPVMIVEAIPAYQSLTLCFDTLSIEPESIEASIRQVIDKGISDTKETVTSQSTEIIEVPVCYQGAYAPDLNSLAAYCKLSTDEVIQQHTQNTYLVNMLGFLPGFLYLSGLDEPLHCPRKESPSLNVPAGAVGIGGNQTGVYPVASPGGWHIIGQTPLSIFDPSAKQPFIAQALDRIRFVPIDVETFEKIKSEQT
jgi:KipI family sensor histidine kinase inhibitor